MTDVREIVLRALDRSSGLLSDPEMARLVLGGQDLELARLGLDSLGRFEAMMQIEDRLGIELDDDELDGLQTVHELVELVRSRLQGP